MQLHEHRAGDVAVIKTGGRIDSTTSRDLAERLTAMFNAGCASAVLDLKDTHYISSAGFREFLVAAKRATSRNGKLVLSSMSPEVRRLFDVGGLLELFVVCASAEEGVRICQQ